eukprot:116273-Rhodomonas_salina.3
MNDQYDMPPYFAEDLMVPSHLPVLPNCTLSYSSATFSSLAAINGRRRGVCRSMRDVTIGS